MRTPGSRSSTRGGFGVILGGSVGSEPGESTAEPTLRRFAFAIRDTGSDTTRQKRRNEVAGYVVGWLESATIADEWQDGSKLWISVAISLGISRDMAKRFSVACPGYVRGSFAPDRAV